MSGIPIPSLDDSCSRCEHHRRYHSTRYSCHGEIHYPSEDYPCTCDVLETDGTGECKACGHSEELHAAITECSGTPGCPCSEFVG